MDRLNPLDASFIDAEDQDRHTSMAIASIAVFEAPPPSYEDHSGLTDHDIPVSVTAPGRSRSAS